jgi:hypothetical protein
MGRASTLQDSTSTLMRRIAMLLVALVAACSWSDAIPPEAPRQGEAILAAHPLVHARLKAVPQTSYEPTALRAVPSPVVVELTNTGDETVALGTVRLSYYATRDAVVFPCDGAPSPPDGAREPTSLRPHESFGFERQVDCLLPLPGRYEVQVFVGYGNDGATRDLVGSFSLTVVATPRSPQAYPSRPGLFAAMIGRQVTRPLSPEAWARGDYHVILAVTNAGPAPVAVGRGHLALVVNKRGSPLPCSGASEPVVFPELLMPGATATATAPLACAPAVEGSYEIAGRLGLEGSPEELEVGRFGLEVTRDPLRFVPMPWPLILSRP